VLLRALEPVLGEQTMSHNRGLSVAASSRALTSGPSRLCQALSLTRAAHNALDLLAEDSPLQLRHDGFTAQEALVTPRIGIHEAVDWPLRFALPGNSCVSGPKRLAGRRIPLEAMIDSDDLGGFTQN
jgi:DNA-3-methyladenine glycosylase